MPTRKKLSACTKKAVLNHSLLDYFETAEETLKPLKSEAAKGLNGETRPKLKCLENLESKNSATTDTFQKCSPDFFTMSKNLPSNNKIVEPTPTIEKTQQNIHLDKIAKHLDKPSDIIDKPPLKLTNGFSSNRETNKSKGKNKKAIRKTNKKTLVKSNKNQRKLFETSCITNKSVTSYSTKATMLSSPTTTESSTTKLKTPILSEKPTLSQDQQTPTEKKTSQKSSPTPQTPSQKSPSTPKPLSQHQLTTTSSQPSLNASSQPSLNTSSQPSLNTSSQPSLNTSSQPSTLTKQLPHKALSPQNPQLQTKIEQFFKVRRSSRVYTSHQIKKLEIEQLESLIENAIHEVDQSHLEVVDTGEKGRGVVAARGFRKGEFVVEYAGDLLSVKEAKDREEEYKASDNVGCYMYYFKHNNKHHCIDATRESGRLGRLLNHSRSNPNCCTKVREVKGTPRLTLVTKRAVCKGEELLYDYGDRSKAALLNHPWLAY